MNRIIEVQREPGKNITVDLNGSGEEILAGIAAAVSSFYKALRASRHSDYAAKAALRATVETGIQMGEETREP